MIAFRKLVILFPLGNPRAPAGNSLILLAKLVANHGTIRANPGDIANQQSCHFTSGLFSFCFESGAEQVMRRQWIS